MGAVKPCCHVCDQMIERSPLCESCLDVVSEVHTIKARPTGKKHLHACDICEGKGYNLNSLSPDGDVLPWPVAAVCWSCGGIGKR